jgi:UDP-GlcNAc:undecaprenyl-phosphate GlcNAc-1-phosphate transferase
MVCLGFFEPVRFITSYVIGSSIIVLTGVLDDKFQISPKQKLIGQLIAALVVVFYGGKINILNLPFVDGYVVLGYLGIPITILWIIGVTNAINLIDGLDGLAAGVSTIAALSLSATGFLIGNYTVAFISLILVGATLGFLYFNFHPASIFMGDSGSLFLGFSLATLSLLHFKQVTMVTFIIPILVLCVPISDTLYAIIRRLLNKQPISAPDKNHTHHRLLSMGFSHRGAVIVIYVIGILFGGISLLLTKLTIGVSLLIVLFSLLLIEVIAETIGLLNEEKYKPLLYLWKFATKKTK